MPEQTERQAAEDAQRYALALWRKGQFFGRSARAITWPDGENEMQQKWHQVQWHLYDGL